MSKDDYVQTGVILLCDKGAVPVPFVATIKKKNHHGMTGGTIRDNYPVLNIPPFGVCSITTLPCLPVMPKWENYPEEPWYIEKYQPLIVSSYCKCKAGGTIKIYANYQDAFAALDDNKKSRVDGIPWVDRIICGILMPGMVVGNVITGRDHETQGVGRGIRQGLKKTFLGLWDVVSHPLDTLGGLATLAAVGVVGYSQPGTVIIASPQERLQKFDSIFNTNLAATDAALKNAVVETVDQKLINGTETERAEFTGELIVAIADIAVGGKGAGAVKKMATSTKAAATIGKFGKVGINAAKLVDDIGSILNKTGRTIKKWTWDKLPNPIKGIFGKKKIATYKHGSSDGGPGTWEKRTTPQKGAEYQQHVTGAPKDTEYVVKTNKMKSGEKKFDGYDPETNKLIDAKDWDTWPPENQKWAQDKIVKEARNDADIAKDCGSKLEYHVPTEQKAKQLRDIFEEKEIDIDVKVTPKPE